jgi:hypothetical protein
MSVDDQLQEHWERTLRARERARRSLPEEWREDPRPEIQEVCDLYVELLVGELSQPPARASRRAGT